jgi:hypothetical protein
MANEALTKLSTEQLSFYDVSFFVDYGKESEKKDFPIIGYKNKTSEAIVW